MGYSLDHPTDTYRFTSLSTKKIIHSKDVKWLDKQWGQYYKISTKDMVQEEIEIYEEMKTKQQCQKSKKHRNK